MKEALLASKINGILLKDVPSSCLDASCAHRPAQHLYTSVCFSLMLVTHILVYTSREEKARHEKSMFMVDDRRVFSGNTLSILRDEF